MKNNAAKGRKAMFAIITKARTMGLSISCQIHLFKVIITPILLYGCEVWGFENLKIIESVQTDFCKLLLKVNKRTPHYLLYSETGLFPLYITVQSRCIKYWSNVMTGKDTKFVKNIVTCMHYYYNIGEQKSKWLQFIDECLSSNGFNYVFQNPHMYEHRIFTTRLENQFIQEWQQYLDGSNRCILYRAIKPQFGFCDILDTTQTHLLTYFTRFKVGNHKLPVETGRWDGTPFAERYCQRCPREIGDEFHYLFTCPLFTNERNKFIKQYYIKHPNMHKMCTLFNKIKPTCYK